jgi:hypothetical protein
MKFTTKKKKRNEFETTKVIKQHKKQLSFDHEYGGGGFSVKGFRMRHTGYDSPAESTSGKDLTSCSYFYDFYSLSLKGKFKDRRNESSSYKLSF